MKPIVVGVDGSDSAGHALRWAAVLANQCDTELIAVNAFVPDEAEVSPWRLAALEGAREELLRTEWMKPALDCWVRWRALLGHGDPRTALPETVTEQGAGLLVVGAQGCGSRPGFLHLGSVAEHLAHHVDAPFAVVPPEAATSFGAIAIGVDGSGPSRSAVDWTAQLAAVMGARVVAITVAEPFLEWTPLTSERDWRRSVEEQIRADWARPIADAGARLEVSVVRGLHTADALLHTAAERRANMLVVGMHGLGGVTALRAGGVAMQVLHRATMPVVLVPPAVPSRLRSVAPELGVEAVGGRQALPSSNA